MFPIEELNILGGFLTGFLITFLFIPSIIRIARIKSLTDHPGGRKTHLGEVPTLGGIAIFTGLLMAMLVFVNHNSWNYLRYFSAGLVILFFVGIKDDILMIDPYKKLIGQIASALLIAIPGKLHLTSLHGFLGIYGIPEYMGIILTVFVLIVIINAFNLIDGIDGLASGIGILTSLVMGVWFWISGDFTYTILAFSLTGSLIAYFRFNITKGPNKIFMGDTGSLLIGLIMGILAIRFNEMNANLAWSGRLISAPAVSIGILIIPLFDTLRVFSMRILQGQSPFKADRNHVHHRLLMIGLTHLQSTLVILAINILFIVFVFSSDSLGIGTLTLVLSLAAALLSAVPFIIYKLKESVPVDKEPEKLRQLPREPISELAKTKKLVISHYHAKSLS
jgi:UDP-GlcNAc:undecaprenyl-phosphate/decaprenyl-phosphate GlcNAc-1-phosphate transferase